LRSLSLPLSGLLITVAALASASGPFDAVLDLRHQARWAAAESLATVELSRLESDPSSDSLEIAHLLYLIADSHYRGVEMPGGQVALGAAGRSLSIRERRLGPDHLEVATSHALLSRILGTAEQVDSGMVHARRALEIRAARLAPTDTLLAESYADLSDLQFSRRDFQGARESLQKAVSILEQGPGTERLLAEQLTQLGVVWIRLDDRERGMAEIQRALDLLERRFGPDEPARWDPLSELAALEINAGNPIPGIALLRQALSITDARYGAEGGESLMLRHNMQLAFQQLGDWTTARHLCGMLLPSYEKLYGPDHPRTLAIRQGRAFANKNLGFKTEALAEFREITSIYEKQTGPLNPNLSFAWREVAVLSRDLGKLAEAKAACEHAIQLETRSPRPMGSGLLSLQCTYVSILEPMGGGALIDSAATELPRIARKYNLVSMLDRANVTHWMARADRASGRPEAAWSQALESERFSSERMRLNLESAPDRRALQLARRQRAYMDLLLDLAGTAPDRAEAAWDRLVRVRGQVAVEMARRRPPLELRPDSVLVAAHGRWIEAQRRCAARLVQAPPRDSLGLATLDQLRSAAEIAEHEYAQRLTHHGARLAAADPGLADVRSNLPPGGVLVGFVEPHASADTARVTAFIARRDGPVQAVDLGRSSELETALAPWCQALSSLPGSVAGGAGAAEMRCRDLGLKVRNLTWDRLAPFVAGANPVFLVPDGPLVNLPWHALPDGAAGYLAETGPLVLPLNAERELIGDPAASTTGSLLAVGAPDYSERPPDSAVPGNDLANWLRSQDPCMIRTFRPLPGTAAEATSLADLWEASGAEAQLLLGPEASEARFKQEAPNQAILHIATHGYVLSDSCEESAAGTRGVGGVGPLQASGPKTFSSATPAPAIPAAPRPPLPESQRVWLAFSGANHARDHQGDENEGLLTAEEVVTLDLEATQWAVLSACHSNLAEGWYREGVRGMVEAFLFAGVRSVIASRWAIEDDATGEWMTTLYTARFAGETDAARAIATASRNVLAERRRSGRSTHPFYWAAFTASGR
jgi:CHAT domain-containing protein/tetratricopeptide (TPR) repeat protein